MKAQQKGRCILHIGITKTGSTTIQEFLYNHLEDDRFHYAHCDHRNSGQALLHAFDWDSPRIDPFDRFGYSQAQRLEKQEQCRRMFAEHIENHIDKTIIISAEVLSVFDPDRLVDLFAFLRQYFETIEVVGYVRHPKSHMESAFQQRLKTRISSLHVVRYSPAFRDIFGKFEPFVGRENIRAWLFDPKGFPDGDVVLDFCRKLGINPPAVKVQLLNDSLSSYAISLFYTYRRFNKNPPSGYASFMATLALRQALTELKGPRLRFHPQFIRWAIEKNQHHIDWLHENHGISLHEDLDKMEQVGIRSINEIMTYADETLEWLAGKLEGKSYLNLRPLSPGLLAKIGVNLFTRRHRLATRRNIAHDVKQLMQKLTLRQAVVDQLGTAAHVDL